MEEIEIKPLRKLLPVLATSLTGCATILSGPDQGIVVSTNPPGAACDVTRNGAIVAHVPATPAEVTVEKTKDDLQILCRKDGYVDSQMTLVSGVDPTAYANIFLGGYGLLSWGIDSALGTDNQYPKAPSLTMGVHVAPGQSEAASPKNQS